MLFGTLGITLITEFIYLYIYIGAWFILRKHYCQRIQINSHWLKVNLTCCSSEQIVICQSSTTAIVPPVPYLAIATVAISIISTKLQCHHYHSFR